MPALSRSIWLSRSAVVSPARAAPRGLVTRGGAGTPSQSRTMATAARAAVTQNSPATPATSVSTGPRTSASANATPMLAPMTAITRVRCASPVRSLASAITAAATAPAPCRARPATIPQMSSARAATTLPSAKTSSPAAMTGLRPIRSERMPNGTWNTPWVSP